MTETQTTPHDWDRLAKLPRGTEINITLEDGTPDGTLVWWYQRSEVRCWIVLRKDNEGNQVAEGDYTTIRRSELAATLGEMGSETILDRDPYHHTRPQEN